MSISKVGIKAVLVIASLTPIYMAFYAAFGIGVLIGSLFLLATLVCLSHLYYGYRWAKFTVVLLNLAFALAQFFVFKFSLTDINSLAFVAVCIVLVINAFILLSATAVADFLLLQATHRSKNILLTLKVLRLLLIAVVAVALALDMTRFWL